MASLKRILCIENSLENQAVIHLGLAVAGKFDIHLCRSGREALSVASGFRPQLVLISAEAECLDGFPTLAALRQKLNAVRLPAILVGDAAKTDELPPDILAVIQMPLDPMGIAAEVGFHWWNASRRHNTVWSDG